MARQGWTSSIQTARCAQPSRWGRPASPGSASMVPTAISGPPSIFQRRARPVCRFITTTASQLGELPEMSSSHRYWNTSRSIAALILLGVIAFTAAGCGPDYGYSGYPGDGYAPYSYGWGNRYYYSPNFVVH